jgi:hypothetical protein
VKLGPLHFRVKKNLLTDLTKDTTYALDYIEEGNYNPFVRPEFLSGDTIVIRNCFFDTLRFPAAFLDTLKFPRTRRRVLDHIIVFDNCFFQKIDLAGDAYLTLKFPKGVEFRNSYIRVASFFRCEFNALVMPLNHFLFPGDPLPNNRITIERCGFDSILSLQPSVQLKERTIREPEKITDSLIYRQPSSNWRFQTELLFVDSRVGFLDISKCKFIKSLFKNIDIYKGLNASETQFVGGRTNEPQGLENVSFPQRDFPLFVRFGAFDPAALNLGTLLSHAIIVPTDSSTIEDSPRIIDPFYDKLKAYCAKRFSDSPGLIEQLQSRFDRQRALIWADFHKKRNSRSFSVNHFSKYILGLIFEWTLRSADRGEINFIVFITLIIFIFGFLYFRIKKFRDVVITLVSFGGDKDEDGIVIAPPKESMGATHNWQKLLKCCWFSFRVFFDPRVSLSFFDIDNPLLFSIVFFEWLLGFIAIILFFIFLASKWGFVRYLIHF